MLVDEARPLREEKARLHRRKRPRRDEQRPRHPALADRVRLKTPRRCWRSISTMARASACRRNICASKARRPKSRATGRARRRSSPAAPQVGILRPRAGRQLRGAHRLRRSARHRHLFLELSLRARHGAGAALERLCRGACAGGPVARSAPDHAAIRALTLRGRAVGSCTSRQRSVLRTQAAIAISISSSAV